MHIKKIFHILYFATFSLLICLFSIPAWLDLSGSFGFKLLNFFCIVAQSTLEGSLLLLLALGIKEKFPKGIFYLFISLTFLLLLGHFINFIMYRLLDSSILYVFKNLFSGGLENFFVTLRAANINLVLLILLALLFPILPLIGIGFFLILEKIEKKVSYHFTLKDLLFLQVFFVLVLLSTELISCKTYSSKTLLSFHKTLPWPCAHSSTKSFFALNNFQIKKPRSEKQISDALVSFESPKIEKQPNIYLFIIEALRKDCISSDIAPHLYAFQKDCLQFPFTLANGNATQISWFSIFHANFPMHWRHYRDDHTLGSIPLLLLKKMGYEISVFSSAELGYHNMEEILFGKNHYLVNSFNSFSGSKAWERDQLAMRALKDIHEKNPKKQQLYITFLDSTHSEYSWPKESKKSRFLPITPFINYIGLTLSQKDLPLIKNRYYNAAHYIDDLIGNFFGFLKEQDLFEDSIIIVLADHGEEFFEEKALFHGTHLNFFQTHIPILCKFGKNPMIPRVSTLAQMDLFPSILHYLSGKNDFFKTFFDGSSVFDEKKSPWTIIAKQNAGLPPREIALTNGKEKIILEFSGNQDILESKELEIQPEQNSSLTMEPLFEKEIGMIFEKTKESSTL